MRASIQHTESELRGLYPKWEIEAFSRVIFEKICGWDYTEQILNKDKKIGADKFAQIAAIVSRLKKWEPLQYILGETEFYGLRLKVGPGVLIPRPETEELVQWVAQQRLPAQGKILDIGTGSGCIALALKNECKGAQVFGIDISEKALEMARKNAADCNLEVEFFETDILRWQQYKWQKFDVMVSNPPYVRELEKRGMKANVLQHEPSSALFVSDSDPLLFYGTIAEFALQYLNSGGKLFFEINESLPNEMRQMLKNKGFVNIEIKKDLNGKNRMAACQKPATAIHK